MTFAIKRKLISFFAAFVIAAAFAFSCGICAFAQGAERGLISAEKYKTAVGAEFDRELEKLQSNSLADGFLQSGRAAESEADWYMLSARAVGRDEDYAAYAETAEKILEERLKTPSEYYLTELARTAAVVGICGGDASDLSGLRLDGAGDNEVIWVAIAQKVNGYDYSAAESELFSRQREDGGFGLTGSDADITAMALNALPKGGEQALAAVGYLKSYYAQNSEDISAETAAQMIIGLCAQGIDPSQSADFTDDSGVRLTDILLSLREEDGGFAHFAGGEANDMSSMQALTALAALGYYNTTGRSLLEPNFVYADVFGNENPCGEAFDDYDKKVLGGIGSACAADIQKLESLKERADVLGADGETLSEIEEKLSQSRRICEEIEELNGTIREEFYPAEEVGLSELAELKSINEKISQYSENDKALILSADELADREETLEVRRGVMIISGAGTAVVLAAVIIYIKRKRRT